MLIIIFFILFLNFMNADLTRNVRDTNVTDGHYGEGDTPVPKKCSDILDTFAEYASDFTMCSIRHARPIKLCEQCVDGYINFSKKYQELMTTVADGIPCKSIFISSDRLNAVVEYYNSILAVWNKGNCNACFEWKEGIPTLSNNTNKFNELYIETDNCIKDTMKHTTNNTEVCEKCMKSYIKLDTLYKSLSADSMGLDTICMDVVDSMNATRSMWSKTLNCCKLRKTPEIVFLCCTALISILPILYYLAVRFYGPIRQLPNVLKQSRFKQTILGSVRGRIN